MTDQEAEALAARLARIWGPEQCHFHVSRFGKFSFNGQWSSGLHLHIETEEREELMIELVQDNLLLMTHQYDDIEPNQTCPDLIARWKPYFRRGCWLSGLPIEATAHEKAEWIQGFSREELDAWNLKI